MTGRHGLLTSPEVAGLLRYRSTDHFLSIRKQLEAKGFPAPIRRNRAFLWDAGKIADWIAAQRDAAAAPPKAAP